MSHRTFGLSSALLQEGSAVYFDGEVHRVTQVSTESFVTCALSDGKLNHISFEELPRLIRRDELQIIDIDFSDPDEQLDQFVNQTYDGLSAAQKRAMEQRIPYVREVLRRQPNTNKGYDDIGREVAARVGDRKPPTGRAIRYWEDQFRDLRGHGPNSLTPAFQERGCRDRWDGKADQLFRLMDDALETHYLKDPRETLLYTHKCLKDLIVDFNEHAADPNERVVR